MDSVPGGRGNENCAVRALNPRMLLEWNCAAGSEQRDGWKNSWDRV